MDGACHLRFPPGQRLRNTDKIQYTQRQDHLGQMALEQKKYGCYILACLLIETGAWLVLFARQQQFNGAGARGAVMEICQVVQKPKNGHLVKQ